ncbi:MAG: protoheme IX farnesyltransferase [Alphaproteobacteria bacterium]|nr:protoheme IX farnesyltransferase [Alphaproteobacteria bacterium]
MVVLTAVVGFVMGSQSRVSWASLVLTALGTALAASCANALNQWVEAGRDARMPRTRRRPLPAGRISAVHAVMFAIVTGVVGLAILTLGVNLLAASLAGLNIFIYVGIYTPLKVRTSLNTLAGAVVGAIPPMLGWAAASGALDTGAWLLGAVLFVWQMPHFLALAWMYRDDYARGGYRMLPLHDADGRLTGRVVVLYALTLVPVTLLATGIGLAGWVYFAAAAALGAWVAWLAVRMLRRRTEARARRLFLASVIYLPLLMVVMMADRPAATDKPVEPDTPQAATRAPLP